jgi:hypothetical protein
MRVAYLINQQTRRLARMPESGKTTLKASLTSEQVHVLAQRPDLRVVTIADGANDNWAFLCQLPEGRVGYQVVDSFHAAEHPVWPAQWWPRTARGRCASTASSRSTATPCATTPTAWTKSSGTYATSLAPMCCLMLSNCSGDVNALTVLSELSRCMTFSVEDRCIVTSLLAQRQEAMLSTGIHDQF